MATRPRAAQAPHRDRHDYGALEQRVSSQAEQIDSNFRQTSGQIADLRQDTRAQIESVRRDVGIQIESVAASIAAISTDIKDQAKSGRTHWIPLLGTVAAMAAALITGIGVVGSMALGPIVGTLTRHEEALTKALDLTAKRVDIETYDRGLDDQKQRNTTIYQQIADVRKQVSDFQITQAFSNGQDAANWAAQLRENSRFDKDNDAIVRDLVRRPEIDSDKLTANERTTAISTRLNEMQNWIQSIFPPFKVIDEIQAALRELRTQQPIAPIAPIAPLAPVVPRSGQ